MKKLIYPIATLFLSIIFSCNKSDISPTNSLALKVADKNLNVVLFDSAHNATIKPAHVKFFDATYATDGSQAIIEANLVFGVGELQLNEVIVPGADPFSRDDEVPWAYCINDGTVMTGLFLDYYVTDNLLNNPTALAAFKTWFQKVVVDWMTLSNLAPKVKNDKPGEYWKKVIGSVPAL